MHEVLVNRLGGLNLPKKSVVRLTDRPDMTLDVYRGRETTTQQQQQQQQKIVCFEGTTTNSRLTILFRLSYASYVIKSCITLKFLLIYLRKMLHRDILPSILTGINSLENRGVMTRRTPGSTGFNIFSSELNVNGYPFKRSKSLLNKGQLLKGKNLLL